MAYLSLYGRNTGELATRVAAMGGSTTIFRLCFPKPQQNGGIVQKEKNNKKRLLTNKPSFVSWLYPYINSAMFSFERDW